MRYHWGLAIGHIYARGAAPTSAGRTPSLVPQGVQSSEHEPEMASGVFDSNALTLHGNDSDVYDSDDPELGLGDRQLDGWEDVESQGSDGGHAEEGEHFTGM